MSKSDRSVEIQRELNMIREAEVDKSHDYVTYFNYDYLEEEENRRETVMRILSKRITSLEIEIIEKKEKAEQRKSELSLMRCYIDRNERLLKLTHDYHERMNILRSLDNLYWGLYDDQAVHSWKYPQADLDRLKKLRDGPWSVLRYHASREIDFW